MLLLIGKKKTGIEAHFCSLLWDKVAVKNICFKRRACSLWPIWHHCSCMWWIEISVWKELIFISLEMENRNAENYLMWWTAIADKNGFVVLTLLWKWCERLDGSCVIETVLYTICFWKSCWWILRYLLEVWRICSVVIWHCRGRFWFEERSRGICPELSVFRSLLWRTASRYWYKLLKMEEKREVFLQLHWSWKVNLEKFWLKMNVQSVSSNFKSVELYLCMKL